MSNNLEELKLDMEGLEQPERIQVQKKVVQQKVKVKLTQDEAHDLPVSCLKDEKITVRFIPQRGTISDPKHVLYGGLAETSTMLFSVPRLRSGVFVNVLTNDEKKYLEAIMGLEDGALNVYNKENNFWSNSTEGGISSVRLTKFDTTLDLRDPIDYIKYKILLANKDYICPSLLELLDKRLASYKYVLVSDTDVSNVAKSKLSTKKQCYMELGRYEDNADVLRTVIEIITSKPLSLSTQLDFLLTKAGDLIESDAKLFLSVIKDPLLNTRILINKCVQQGFISKRGDFYYLRSDNTPLCEGGEDPVLSVAAKYLNSPKRQDMKFALEAKLKY